MRPLSFFMMIAVATTLGCASSLPVAAPPAAVRLDELATVSTQGLSDDALIAEVDKRGVSFVLSAQDIKEQRMAGVSDGVLRYLQGRACDERPLRASVRRAPYRLPAYSGTLYLGFPYLGYVDGTHYYGNRYRDTGRLHGGGLSGQNRSHSDRHRGAH